MTEIDSSILGESLEFEEAIKFFKEKAVLTPGRFYKLARKYKSLAFSVGGYTNIEVLQQFYEKILQAIEEGTTLENFKEEMNVFLEEKGYEGLTAYRADVIFRNNVQTAYQVGHYEAMTDETILKYRPYWQYHAVGDHRTRVLHRAMDAKVYRADDPIWDIWYPPNGHRCRCSIRTVSERQLEKEGLILETEMPKAVEYQGRYLNVLPDRNFDYNPAKERFKPDLEGYPKSLKKAYEQREINKPPK